WARRRAYHDALEPRPRPVLDAPTARGLLGVGITALLLAVLDLGVPLGLRAHYLRAHGIAANGLLQSAIALAQQLSAAFIAYLWSYAFGRLSAAGGPTGIRDYTRKHWKALVMVAAAAFALVMLMSGPLLALFYSSEFAVARPLMAWTLLAEFCRVMTQVWSLGVLPLGAVRAWIAIGVVGPVAYVLGYVLLAPVAGTLAMPMAAASGALIQLGVAGVLMSRRGVTLRPGDAALLLVVLGVLAVLARWVSGTP
ncbi:MAG TPA: hypothetical protein VJY35_02975, partial [Candidatus Eisenbacteria bacterium]|nr:hypothetical protein [Candidatus Eisenbacteria bacterium]